MAAPKTFPFTRVPKGQKVDISKIRNPLDPSKLANPTVKTLAQSVSELEQNDNIMLYINGLKANKNVFLHMSIFACSSQHSNRLKQASQSMVA